MSSLCVLALLAVVGACVGQYPVDPVIYPIQGYTLLKSSNQSAFYQVNAAGTESYGYPVYLVNIKGSRYQMGWDYGFMLANEIEEVYNYLLHSLLPSPLEEPIVKIIQEGLDWQWNDYLSTQLPEQYKQELQGIADGATAAGNTQSGLMVTRAITLANAPGDLQDFILILIREYQNRPSNTSFHALKHKIHGMCSMFGVWGSRTQGNLLFSGRNLDWNANTGINKYKAITVFSPDDGSIPHVVTGYVGLWGALLGMSAEGLTVHEANLEETEITFNGFPWLLRLRYIMENAHNNTEAKALWEATNNTVGFNHMVTSASDAAAYLKGGYEGPGVAIAMETMFDYTAYFASMDPREVTATYLPTNSSTPVQIGFPLPEALYRTNHGYDPVIRAHYEWSQAPSSWSMERYTFIYEAIKSYEENNIPIGLEQAANITSIAGDKGTSPYLCQNNTDGSNVLSVAFSPATLTMAAAWERSNGTNWRPAACSPYLLVDMTQWFAGYLDAKRDD